jgi:hypothetical protein
MTKKRPDNHPEKWGNFPMIISIGECTHTAMEAMGASGGLIGKFGQNSM